MADVPTLSAGQVLDVSLESRMEQAFLDYSMSVIVGRALPDVRDGLKPVQRRILYSMYESGLHPDRPYRKCASAVGEVMKTYHPHGDSSIYDALVRMAQEFATREPLVDGHGNFGSIDGDPPAAMRYTEARLSPLAMELLAGIDEETVDFVDNYDGYDTEPVVLPARFPNLLVNGASGIAVGMATNIPPHNLGEVIDACLTLLEDPDADLDRLMRHVPAPDFPTGARIVEGDGIRDAYAAGRGAVAVEAVASTETRTGNLPRIVITEIPYQVNKSALLQRIADLVSNRKIDAIRDLRDESSRDGMRIVIELKRGEDPGKVLERLYRSTDLRTNFNVNLVALVDGAPRTLGLVDCLRHYLAHQRDVLTRRTEHRLRKARDRAHVVEGLLLALDHLDEVIALIRGSESAAHARTGLIERFAMSEIQAQAVLDMQLRRLAALERAALEDEYQQLQGRIARLEEILGDASVLDGLLGDELREIKRLHATPRRSRIVGAGISAEDVLAGGSQAGFEAQEVTVLVTRGGYLKPLARRRATPAHKHPHDPLVAVLRCTTDDTLLLVDEAGTGHRVGVGDVPVVKANQRGTHVGGLLGGGPDAKLAGAVVLGEDEAVTLVTVSAAGQVKRTAMSEFADARQRSLQAAGVKDDDHLAAVATCRDDDDLLLAHTGGYVTRFPAGEVRTMGRTASGVAGMSVPKGARIVSLSVTPADATDVEVLTVAADATAKRTPLAEYPAKGRGGKGLMTGASELLWCGVASDLHLHGDDPVVVRAVDLTPAKRAGRGEPLGVEVAGPAVPEAMTPGTE
ncbi:DNA gyrase/topoisomerase IV subunit A [Egicoccus halophilus]|uniref:DNA topoisomerase (ATP-hydrolyzing) n=1 Tax=Egicoccus halophilus TaxID=1670830 RepID=A0A8J3ACW6_9ACTN|nr:DNA topoisomerase (ATP-hydrolyzing) [Egicoccus halophilus]GGI05464.1 DNA gyrase subunit A [Egicoccus halophilus]